jgi:hypothetical protein
MGSTANGATIGTLQAEDFGTIETLLASRGILAPIVTWEMLEPDNRTFLSRFDRLAASCVARFRTEYSIVQEVDHCFVDARHPNAFASRSPLAPGKYFIVLLIGLIGHHDFFYRLFADHETRRLLELEPKHVEDDAVRPYVIQALISLGFQWLVEHELGHIKNGHLHLKVDEAFGASSSEMMERSGLHDRNRTLHTLEMDADSFASGKIVSWLTSTPAEAHPHVPFLKTPRSKARAFMITMYAMLRTLDIDGWNTKNLFDFTHPPALIRILRIGAWGFAFSEAFPQVGIQPAEWKELSWDCIGHTERVLFERPDPAFMQGIQRYFGTTEWLDYGNALRQRWSGIRPQLQKHALGGQLAPAQASPA